MLLPPLLLLPSETLSLARAGCAEAFPIANCPNEAAACNVAAACHEIKLQAAGFAFKFHQICRSAVFLFFFFPAHTNPKPSKLLLQLGQIFPSDVKTRCSFSSSSSSLFLVASWLQSDNVTLMLAALSCLMCSLCLWPRFVPTLKSAKTNGKLRE